MNAGYSGKPTVAKLGVKPGFRVCFVNAPAGYVAGLGLPPVEFVSLTQGDLDFVQLFVTTSEEYSELFPAARDSLKKNGQLWASWPKGGKKGELNETAIRDIGLSLGMVDVKVIAVDEKWSGLKFMFRLSDR